jgi:dephospho-CoA kinase
MIVIGLTGSIGMGKTTVAKLFKQCGAAVCDSDAIVHELLGHRGKAVSKVAALFAGVQEGEAINRTLLGKAVFDNAAHLQKLEALLHPLVRAAQEHFIRRARLAKKSVVVLDIPLLFETARHERCDYTVVVTAPHFLQRQRVLKRLHMSEEKLARVLARQMKDSEKRKRADFIIQTGLGKCESLKEVRRILKKIIRQKRSGVSDARNVTSVP